MNSQELQDICTKALLNAYSNHLSLGEKGKEEIQKNQFGETASELVYCAFICLACKSSLDKNYRRRTISAVFISVGIHRPLV